MEWHAKFPMVQSDIDLLAVYFDGKQHEEASDGVSSIPGRIMAGNFQETTAQRSQRISYGMEEDW